ncbi:hypothetical protein ACWB3E_19320 [Acinetobacter baumannii]
MLGESTMADIVTRTELEEAKVDCKDLGDALNTKQIINPRWGAPFKSLPLALEKVENNGGYISAPTLTALQAIMPSYNWQLARVDATGDEYRWNPAATPAPKWEPTGRNYLNDSKAYTDEKTYPVGFIDVDQEDIGFQIVDELTRIILTLSKKGELKTALAKFGVLNVVTNDSSDLAFSVVDDLGRIAFAIRKDGQILPDFRSLSQSYGPHVLKPDATVDDVNQALQQFKIVSLSPRSQIFINKPIKIPNFGILDFALSDIYLDANANCHILQNDDLFAGADLIVAKNGRLHGRASQQTRNLTGDFRSGYYGFGCAFSGVKDLQMENFYVEDTNGWGVAYLRCGTVNFKKFRFAQDEKRMSQNGDGITGQAKRIFIDGVEGFTNDDMVAVTSGKGTLQGIDIGVSNDECFDIEVVDIRNIHGEPKNGVAPLSGIGIYPTAGKTMRNVTINGVTGEFDIHVWQTTNYWPGNGTASIENLSISNSTAKAKVNNSRILRIDTLKNLTIENNISNSANLSRASVLVEASSKVESLTVKNTSNKMTDVTNSASLVRVMSQSAVAGLRKLIVENSDVLKTDPSQKNALITTTWAADAPLIDVYLANAMVDTASLVNGDQKASDILSSTNESIAKYRYSGAQKLAENLTLGVAWTGTSTVVIQSNNVKLSGFIQASSFANNTLITTLPKLMRPTSLKKYRLYAVEGDFNFIDITVNEVGEVRLIDSHASNTSNVFDLSNIEFLI